MAVRISKAIFDIALVVLMIAAPTIARAVTYHVDAGGGGDYETIQAGISAASDGDTVLVAPGTYAGAGNRDLELGDADMVIFASGGPAVTTIDCQQAGRGFLLTGFITASTHIRGFTITNARLTDTHGAGIYCVSGSPVIADCIFDGNQNDFNGGGIACVQSSASIENCLFTGNSGYIGGALYLVEFHGSVTDCAFFANASQECGGGIYLGSCSGTVSFCSFARNEAPGCATIACYDAVTQINNCLVTHGVGCSGISCGGSGDPIVFHCLFFGNEGGDTPCGSHSDNLFVRPRFCDLAAGDLTLNEESVGLPAFNPWGERIGAYGQGCMSAPAVENATWGEVKVLYR
ncbi:MAG: right-handed parallel beta-helix repeat-containing protein [bacterium]